MDQSLQLIRTLQPELQPAAVWLINQLRAAGLPAIVVSARRSAAVQKRLIEAGRTTATRSLHLSGSAIDVGFASVPTSRVPPDWWSYAGSLWESAGGRWGGRFSTPDVVHFDSG